MDSAGSSRIGCFTILPLIKGLLKNPGISGTGERLISTYSVAPVNEGQDFNGSFLHSGSKEPQGTDLRLVFFQEDLMLALLQIQHGIIYYFFLYFFSHSLRAISLAPMLSSLCLEDLGLGLWPDLRSCLPDPRSE